MEHYMQNILLKIISKIFRKILFSILENYELSDFQMILIVMLIEMIIYILKRKRSFVSKVRYPYFDMPQF